MKNILLQIEEIPSTILFVNELSPKKHLFDLKLFQVQKIYSSMLFLNEETIGHIASQEGKSFTGYVTSVKFVQLYHSMDAVA